MYTIQHSVSMIGLLYERVASVHETLHGI